METIAKIQLGALLHDIGKIVRRAGDDRDAHSFAGVKFLKDIKLLEGEKEILEMVQYHHASELKQAKLDKNSLAYLIYEADNIASGIDRRLYEGKERGNEMMPLNSVFNKVRTQINEEEKSFLLVKQEEKSFNMPRAKKGNLEQSQYAQILLVLKENLMAIQEHLTPEKLDSLLESTSTFFPSSAYVDQPDISYYDHVRLTAAAAACMYLYDQENPVDSLEEEYYKTNDARSKEKFLYVSGEFSGIQDFIYTITSKMAMKSLRGRSFYLELFIEHIIDEILKALSLSRVNLLYSGGSQFYMLLPNTKEARQVLENIKEIINDFLLQEVGAALYFELTSTPTTANELGNNLSEEKKTQNLVGEIYKRLSIQSSEAKLSRYSIKQLESLLDEDSEINRIHNDTNECAICKKPEDEKILKQNAEKVKNNTLICNSCKEFIKLGSDISKIYLSNLSDELFMVETIIEQQTGLCFPIYPVGFVAIQVMPKNTIIKKLKNNSEIYRYYAVNSYHVGEGASKNIWVGNYNIAPDDKDKETAAMGLIEFKELAKKSKGIQRLAVLRADVDNLGMLFQSGFENKDQEKKYQYATLSKSAVLSRNLSDFFKRKISLILEKSAGASDQNQIFQEYCHVISNNTTDPRDIVLVYSGGDDIFAIGTWNDIIEFSVDLRNAFKEYTNAKITLSAGIGFFSQSFPVYQMAKITGELESLAKQYSLPQSDIPTKDAVALFGDTGTEGISHVYCWDDFIDKVLYEKLKFLKEVITLSEKMDRHEVFVGKSKLYSLVNLLKARLTEDSRLDVARFAYTIARLEKTKENDEKYQLLKKQLFEWAKNKKDAQELMTAIYLLIYEVRGESNE